METGFFGFFDEARFLLRPIGLADGRARLELEDLLLVQPNPQDIPGDVHYAEQETDLLIDRLRSSIFTQPVILALLRRVLVDID